MQDTLEELRELKTHLKTTVDELLSLRNRLAEYDSEFIGRLQLLEVDINRYGYLDGSEKERFRERIVYDCDSFKRRIGDVIEGLTATVARHTEELAAFDLKFENCPAGCPEDLRHNLAVLSDVYRQHINVMDGMRKIYLRYVANLEGKLKTV